MVIGLGQGALKCLKLKSDSTILINLYLACPVAPEDGTGIEFFEEKERLVGSSCPVVARRAKSDLSRRSY